MSLAGSFGGVAAADMVMKEAGQSIGKPLDAMTSPGSRAGAAGHSEINWTHFNYPPLLRVIHYDLEELPSSLSGIVRRLNISFLLTTFTCMLNVLNTLIIVLSTKAPSRWLLQSVLHLLMLPALALLAFYAGYRGLAEPDASLLQKFKVAQPILGFIYFLFFIVPWGCANGLVKLGEIREHSHDGSVYWTVVILLESGLWAVNVLFAVLNSYRAHNFDQFGATATAGRV